MWKTCSSLREAGVSIHDDSMKQGELLEGQFYLSQPYGQLNSVHKYFPAVLLKGSISFQER